MSGASEPPTAARRRAVRALPVLAAALLVLAAGLRWYGAGFGLPALNDPDELMFQLGAVRILTSATLNPGWFGHPATTTMYALALVDIGVFLSGWLSGAYAGPAEFVAAVYPRPEMLILPGRLVMAAFGVLAVWQTLRLGRMLRPGADGWIIGLFAAALLATSPVFVQYAQIIRSDMMGTAFVMLCLGAALRIADDGRTADYAWAALWLALAVASKWPFAIAALSVAGACLSYTRHAGANARQQVLRLAGFAVLAPVLLVVISPYLVLDYQTVLVNLTGEARPQHLGSTGAGPLGNAWWYISGPLWSGFGAGGLVLAAGGLAVMARDARLRLVLVPFLVVHFAIICLHDLRWERWVVPIMPILALGAGLIAARLIALVKAQPRLAQGAVLGALVVMPLTLVPPTLSAARMRMNDTRQQATAWVDRRAAQGATIMIEHFAFDMVHRAPTVSFPLGTIGCVNAQAMLDGRIDYSLVEGARKGRSKFDYGTMAAAARPTCTSDYYVVTEMERYAAERGAFPAEYGAYAALLEDGVIAATFRPEPGISTGPVVHVIARRAP